MEDDTLHLDLDLSESPAAGSLSAPQPSAPEAPPPRRPPPESPMLMAVLAVVLGVVACCCSPCCFNPGLILAVVALVYSFQSQQHWDAGADDAAYAAAADAQRWSKWALICSAVMAVLGVVLTVLMYAFGFLSEYLAH